MLIDEVPYFIVKDVCDILDISNSRDAIKTLDVDDVDSTDVIDSMGRKQRMNTVTESGVYDLILQSRKPEAKKFKRWIIKDVLPSIRKYGMYATEDVMKRMIEDPDWAINLLTTMKEERLKRITAEEKAHKAEHTVICMEDMMDIHDLYPQWKKKRLFL